MYSARSPHKVPWALAMGKLAQCGALVVCLIMHTCMHKVDLEELDEVRFRLELHYHLPRLTRRTSR